MYISIFLRERSTAFPHLVHNLAFVRFMGGGPRTFPGGLNKWQWKRLHEKKAREKEKRLLEQEKQVYQARIRSEIRSNLAGGQPDPNSTGYSPLSSQDHIRALADRFMKEGAEDLWNQADGPIKTPSSREQNRPINKPIDLRRLVPTSGSPTGDFESGISTNVTTCSKPRNYSVGTRSMFSSAGDCENSFVTTLNNFVSIRHYSVNTKNKRRPKSNYRRNESSSSDDSDLEMEGDLISSSSGNERWPKIGSIQGISSEEEEMEGRANQRKMMSSAALGKYDSKTTKRVPLKFLEDEDDLSQYVQVIRNEFNKRNVVAANVVEKSDEEPYVSQKKFSECNISPFTVKALNSAGYVQMTRVQDDTLSACLEGEDALVKARTGTGKTAAFLIPAIETVLKASSSGSVVQRVPPIYVLIICPTRELASQLAAEANVLLKHHDGIGVLTLVGGTRFKDDQRRLESDSCQIVIATPGRLLDHIENKSGLSVRLMGLKMLILDEADHLLNLGFRKDMEKIVDCLPRQRQSLFFSATIPKEVRRISQLVLKREHVYIDTIGLSCQETHAKVKQSYIVAPHEQHFQILHHLLKDHLSQTLDYKVIVFCTTAMLASLLFSLFRETKMNVREIHSRKPQLARTRVSDEFKESKRIILITSDVSARGMNYPDVTLVVQVGIPSNREQYIHRLGRTGREGKEGEGILLLAPWEEYFMDEIKDLPIEKIRLPRLGPDLKLKDSMAMLDDSIKEAAYHAWLGYYNSIGQIGRDKTTLVELAKQFSESIGLQKPPALFRKTAVKMGLREIPGIRIRK